MMAALILLTFLTLAAQAPDEPPDPYRLAREAQEALDNGDYDRAIDLYKKSKDQLPDAPQLDYNLGVTHYEQGDLKQAKSHFLSALRNADPALEAKTRYNLGNCDYSSALGNTQDPSAAIESLKSAASYYRDALTLDPTDDNARANLEQSYTLMKLLEKQQEQQQQSQDQEQQQKQNQEEEDEQQNQQNKQESQQDEEQSSRQQDQQGEQEEQPQEGEDKQQADKPEQPQDGDLENTQPEDRSQQELQAADQEDESSEMSPEQLQRLLQMIRDKEMQRREMLLRKQQANAPEVEKDW